MKYSFFLLNIVVLFFVGCTAQNMPNKSQEKKERHEEQKLKEKIESDKVKIVEKKIDAVKKRIEIVEKKVQPKVIIKEKIKTVIVEKPVIDDSKIVVGIYEYVYIPFFKKTYKAKIDTGATTTSMHAMDIREFERDGKKWVKFKYESQDGKLIDKSLPIERTISIKRHGVEKNQKRYVVKLRINLGDSSELVDVSLTNRSKFNYPVLIGRNYLNGYIVVDVSKKYVTKPKKN